jgi:hypothetical protein
MFQHIPATNALCSTVVEFVTKAIAFPLRHGRIEHIVSLAVSLFVSAIPALADAQEAIIGKQITYFDGSNTQTIRVLRNGHILTSMVGNECRPSGGSSGGEAVIGGSTSVSFSCKLAGKMTTYTVQSVASFENGALNIQENWTMDGKPSARQKTSITINGSSCSGTYMGKPITRCTVQ